MFEQSSFHLVGNEIKIPRTFLRGAAFQDNCVCQNVSWKRKKQEVADTPSDLPAETLLLCMSTVVFRDKI